MKKYSKKFTRDYDFYVRNRDRFTFAGVEVKVGDCCLDRQKGTCAKEAFHSFDTTGKMIPTSEPELLASVVTCKKSINLHIRMWVEGYDDVMEGIPYYMGLFDGEPPPWVEDSFRKQLLRRRRNK